MDIADRPVSNYDLIIKSVSFSDYQEYYQIIARKSKIKQNPFIETRGKKCYHIDIYQEV